MPKAPTSPAARLHFGLQYPRLSVNTPTPNQVTNPFNNNFPSLVFNVLLGTPSIKGKFPDKQNFAFIAQSAET